MLAPTWPEMLFLLFALYGLSGYAIWAYETMKGRSSGRAAPPPSGA
jgi:hypothetical protein